MDNNKARELAAALREHNAWRMGLPPYDKPEQPRHLEGAALSAVLEQAATALETYAQQAEMCGEWQPIETYKKGTVLLAAYIVPSKLAAENGAPEYWDIGMGSRYGCGDKIGLFTGIVGQKPTHWMPLPKPPLARAEKMGV